MNNYYNIIIIFILIFLLCSYKKKYENLTKIKNNKKRLAQPEEIYLADEYAFKKICAAKGYGYEDGMCTHIKKSTCIRENPGYILNPEDLKTIEKLKKSPCLQQLDAFKPVKTDVGEWLVAKEEDKKYYKKLKKELNDLNEEIKKGLTEELSKKLIKLETKLFRAERDSKDRCQASDQSFKMWCLKNKLDYKPHKNGIGECIITPEYCESKIMNYDKENKKCYPKDSTAESIFGATLVRGIQAQGVSEDTWNCKTKACYQDEWCAGAGICKPISNPGKSCWKGHHESCWCHSKCKLPFNSGAIEAAFEIVGVIALVIAAVALVVVTGGAAAAAFGAAAGAAATAGIAAATTVAGMNAAITAAMVVGATAAAATMVAAAAAVTVTTMAAGALGARAAQQSLEAARCSAGEDGENLPGGKNGGIKRAYMHNSQPGCAAWYHCPPGRYCPIGNGRCKISKDPGSLCPSGQHSWCKGDSDCIPYVNTWGLVSSALSGPVGFVVGGTIMGAMGKCSAGKDGINPVGKQYKTITVENNVKKKPNILFEKKIDNLKNLDEFKMDPTFVQTHGMVRPPNFIEPEKKKVLLRDNGNKNYMALGHSGCGPAMPCPPGYYCPFGAGSCKRAKNPGEYCLAGQDSWCKGRSRCMISSKCSCGKDGINAPGPLYYKDEHGEDILEKGMIYDNGNKGYTCLNAIGCSAEAETPPGYYCKTAFHKPRLAQKPGSGCRGSANAQCQGRSTCRVGQFKVVNVLPAKMVLTLLVFYTKQMYQILQKKNILGKVKNIR